MKKVTFLGLLTLFALGVQAQATIQSENFNANTLPAGWERVIVSGDDSYNWYFGDSYVPTSPGYTFSTPAAIYNDDVNGPWELNNTARLIAPPVNTVPYTTLTLSFDYSNRQADGFGNIKAQVFDGTAWQQVFFLNEDASVTASGAIDVTTYANEDFQVRFVYSDGGGYSAGAGIDNYLLQGTYDNVPNDECSGATNLTCGLTLNGTTVDATEETAVLPDCSGVTPQGPGVWYKFSDEGIRSIVTLNLCQTTTAGFNPTLSVFKGSCGAMACVTANDDSCGLLSQVSFQSDGVSDYYVLVSATTEGDFIINAACQPTPPPNDEIANAIDALANGNQYTDYAVPFMYATTESTPLNTDVNGCDPGPLPYVWYVFTPEADGTATLSLPTPGGINLISFYSAPAENATVPDLDWVNQATNTCSVMTDTRSITITAGTTYYAAVMIEGGNSDVVIEIMYNMICAAPPVPNAPAAQTACQGATLASLDADAESGYQVTWYMQPGGEPLDENTQLQTATYYVTHSIEVCESESLEVSVTVNPTPETPEAVDTQTFAEGETVADLEVEFIEGATINWYIINDAEETISIPATTVLEDGMTYYVSQTVGDCSSSKTPIAVTLEVMGLSGFSLSGLTAYPNPVTDRLTINCKDALAGIIVTNMLGQAVLSQTATGNNVTLAMAALPSGNYIVKVQAANGRAAIVKIVKQ